MYSHIKKAVSMNYIDDYRMISEMMKACGPVGCFNINMQYPL